MQINTVSIIGLGALGVMFGRQMAQNSPAGSVRFIAGEQRIRRYQNEGFVVNGQACHFNYIVPEAQLPPADLLIFAVKAGALESAIRDARGQVGPHTVIVSLLNGISSEEIIGAALGNEKILHCVAQSMDVVKEGNNVHYQNMGKLVIGEQDNTLSPRLQAVTAYLQKVGISYEIPPDILRHVWNKFMLNVGVNQASAIYDVTYGGLQQPGPARQAMQDAMQEAMAVAQKAGIRLTEADIPYWMDVLDKLGAEGFPSMTQDVRAKRKTEKELFSGTVIRLGAQYGVPTPVNQMFYEKLSEMEQGYTS